jgi:hypothetical protein
MRTRPEAFRREDYTYRFIHLPHWSKESENKEKFKASSWLGKTPLLNKSGS